MTNSFVAHGYPIISYLYKFFTITIGDNFTICYNKLEEFMIDLQCPNCSTILTVSRNKEQIVCKKCLLETGKKFIMIESESNPKYKNLGDGFFQKE
jgi:hypothetical protein